MEGINILAVVCCGIINLLLGALWYSPLLFQKAWFAENNMEAKDYDPNPVKTYGLALVFALLSSFGIASFFAGGDMDWTEGTIAGFLTGATLASTLFGIIALFELKSWKYILIHFGFITLYFTIIGGILAVWTD